MQRIDIIGSNGGDGLHYEAKTRKNGGELSFSESAELWKKVKPQYEVEDKDSWAGKFTERNRKWTKQENG